VTETEHPETEFDWTILQRPTAMAMVRGQLEFSWSELAQRLRTISQEQLDWAPAPGTLRVVRRGGERTARTLGSGEWVAEWPDSDDAPGPRTIGWLVGHLTEAFFERWEWTFGDHQRRREHAELSGEVKDAVAGLTRWVTAWRDGIRGLEEDAVMTVGLSSATEIEASAPFGHLVLHMNRELIHHGAEICVLQDLYEAGDHR
jgi:hypothetical protein